MLETFSAILPAASRAPAAGEALRVEPYLHLKADHVFNPHTDSNLLPGEPGYAEVRALVEGRGEVAGLDAELVARLRQDGWLVDAGTDLDGRFLLKYVSLEAHTVCNQACFFCPVSVDRREKYFMPTETYAGILDQLVAYRSTLEAVVMISYNEPTIDPRFVEQVAMIRDRGLPPAVLSNGSGLTPKKTDAIVAMGGLRFFSVNLSTLDRDRYRQDRGADHLPVVLRNLDYAKDRELAAQMDVVVLGTGDEEHRAQHAAIADRFAGSRFTVKYFEVNDRAGYLEVGSTVGERPTHLAGCDHMGSRPIQHLHVTPDGKCILCCQDYSAHHVVGDLTRQTVEEVMTGPAMRLLRRWTYGHEAAPDDFICRNCEFALRR